MNPDEHLTFFNPWAEVQHRWNRVPHWEQPGAVYFVTWRLADSIPADLLEEYGRDRSIWMAKNPEPRNEDAEMEYHRRFSARMDQWMDAGHGECLLRNLENRAIVSDALQFFEGQRVSLISFVTMPNHVHVLFSLHPDWTLEQVLHSWKSFSSKGINQRESLEGMLWMKDYFDRLVRDGKHFGNCVRYIRNNPVKGSLSGNEYTLYENELAQEIE